MNWISITTMEDAGAYEVELEECSNIIRHRRIYHNMYGQWMQGYPVKDLIKGKDDGRYQRKTD